MRRQARRRRRAALWRSCLRAGSAGSVLPYVQDRGSLHENYLPYLQDGSLCAGNYLPYV